MVVNETKAESLSILLRELEGSYRWVNQFIHGSI